MKGGFRVIEYIVNETLKGMSRLTSEASPFYIKYGLMVFDVYINLKYRFYRIKVYRLL